MLLLRHKYHKTVISITHDGTARATTVYYGTTAQPTTNENSFSGSCNIDVSGSNKYFKITRGSNAAYWTQIVITYETTPASAYTVTFTKTDGSTEAITESSVGAGVTPPTMDSPCDGWAFQGWSKSQSTSPTSTTVLNTETLTNGKYYPSSDVTLYPVYTKSGGSSFSSYTLLSLGSTVTDGKYLISTGSYTMAGSGKTGASFTPGNTESTAKEYTITTLGDGVFTIKGPDNKYIGGTSGSTTLSFDAATPSDNNYKWKYNSTGINFQGQTTRYIRANGTTDFRNYTSSNGTSTKLYKRNDNTITYYYSYPNCCSDPGLAYGTGSVTKTFGDGTFKNTLTNSHSVSVTYSTSPTGVATVAADGTVTIVGAGTTTITASSAAQTVSSVSYCADEASYTLTVNKANISPTLTYTPNSVAVGEDSSAPTVGGNPGSGGVTYTITSARPFI